jgi:hypothetical protein
MLHLFKYITMWWYSCIVGIIFYSILFPVLHFILLFLCVCVCVLCFLAFICLQIISYNIFTMITWKFHG